MRQQGLSEPSVVPANDTVVAKTPGLSPTQDRVIIAINQVEYSNTPDGPLIHIFGRDVDGSTREIMVRGFRPYFYVLQSEAERLPLPEGVSREVDRVYYSIRGEPLNRIYTRRPTDVRDAREHFHHYEADIPFATRFLIDRGLTAGVEAPPGVTEPDALRPVDITAPARVAMIDIECDDSRGFPESSRDPILCISAHDSFSGMTGTFITASGISAREELTSARNGKAAGGCGDPSCHSIQIYDDEPAMIRGFAGWMKETDPDILSGWNFTDFDLPYILGRMNALGIPPASLSRLPGQVERAAVRGRAIFDLLAGYRKMQPTQRESYRLDAVAEAEVGQTKVRYQGRIIDLWQKDPVRLVEYNYQDVALCVAINEKNRIIEFYREISRYVGCPLDRTLNSSNVIDIYILRKASGRFVLPSKGFAAADEFAGATVFEPAIGVHENVVVLDLKSLYPMAMMTINASPETKEPSGSLRAPNGVRFRNKPDGLVRSIISELMKERDEKKAQRNNHPFGSPEYVLLDLQQNVLKVIMNTYYGVSGYTRFRLYDREIGAAVTSVGRAIIEHTRRVIEEKGYSVIYGDTDSCMIQIPPGTDIVGTIRIAKEIEGALNDSYAGFALRELNAPSHYFSIKFEKVYRRFFQAGKKKRYAGHLVWKEGKDVDEVDIVGFETRRSDTPQITREVQKTVIAMILRGENFPTVRSYLGGVIRNYRAGVYPLDAIAIPGGIGKQLDDYENDDAHVRGAKYANEFLGTEFARGSKPKRVYIRAVTGKYPKTDVLCFEYSDQVPPEFVVDRELMLQKTIQQPISRILEALGWQWADVDPSRTTLAQFGFT